MAMRDRLGGYGQLSEPVAADEIRKVRRPSRIGTAGTENAPGWPGRAKGGVPQAPPKFADTAIGLHVVAATTGGHHVLPNMFTAPTAWDDMIEAGGWRVAVDATTAVTREHRSAGERDLGVMRYTDEPDQADHSRQRLG